MPTRKQKRRREKDRRHEYEYVYVDDAGQEVEVEETEATATARPAKDQQPGAKGKPKGTTSRSLREPPEPSWSRSVRRAVPWQIGIVIVMVLLLRNSPLASRLMIAIIYGALFIPLMYMTDRMVRNRWLKQQARVQPKDGGSKGQRGPR
jgi:hypothetical protein